MYRKKHGSKAAKAMLFSFVLVSLIVTRTFPVLPIQAGVAVAHADDNHTSVSTSSSHSSDDGKDSNSDSSSHSDSSSSSDSHSHTDVSNDNSSSHDDGDSHDGDHMSTSTSTVSHDDNHDGDDDDHDHDACDEDHAHDSQGDSSGSSYYGSKDSDNHDDESHNGDDDNCPPVVSAPATSTVKVIVNVVNTAGGAKAASDFTVNVTGTHPSPASFSGSASGTIVTLGNGTYNVTEATSTNYTASFSSGCSGTMNGGDAKVCTITDTFNAPQNGGNNPGSITVCKVIEDASGTIIDGSAVSGKTFMVPGIVTIPSTTAAAAGTLATTNFTTPLTLNTKLFGSSVNNAQCVTYSNLALGHWYYGQEQLATSSQWAAPKYNDQDTIAAGSLSNFFSYSGELFDANASNDGARNTNADGDINLIVSRPVRQLVVLNQFLGATPTSTPPCGSDKDHNGPDGDNDEDDVCPAPTSTVPTADLSISKMADVTSTVEGGTINYTLSVLALGPATSTGVVATDVLPSGLTFVHATSSVGSYATSTGKWTIGDLAASSTATLMIAATANAGTAGTTILNTAVVSENASTTDPNPHNNSSTVPVIINPNGCTTNCGGGGTPATPQADLSVSKTANVTSTVEGGTINYTITVSALGPATSTGVVATDTLPTGLTLTNATASVGSYATSTGTWTIGDLAASSTATLSIAAMVKTGTAGTTILNTAVVGENSSTTDPNPGNNSSTVPVIITTNGGGTPTSTAADISIAKTVDNANPSAGATVNYTVTVSALGPATSTFVDASDLLPTGLSLVSATTSQGAYNMSTGDWNIGTLGANATATLTIAALVGANEQGQTITNTATVSELASLTDPNTANNTASVSLTVAGGPQLPPEGGCIPNVNCPSVSVGGGGTPIPPGPPSNPTPTPTPTPPPGQVLGASCGLYLTTYIHPIRKDLNNPSEVKKLQTFLNQNLGLNIPVTGYYGPMTIAAVNQFQVKYHIEVLAPWVPHGLDTEFTPTSYVYKTTQRWINLIECSDLNLPIPPLP